jgi:hypothetical protein
MWQIWGTGKVRRGFWCGEQMERGHLENIGIDGMIILKWVFVKWDGGLGLD